MALGEEMTSQQRGGRSTPLSLDAIVQMDRIVEEWSIERVLCHYCGRVCFPWHTDDETWAKVEPILGQEQTCFNCFVLAWLALELPMPEPFEIRCG